jgi:hypothetical protein
MSDGTTTEDYRNAPSGIGPLAAQWADKPHRLVYDLAGEVERIRALFRIAAGHVSALSGRIGRQVEAGEPLGELDVMNELFAISAALANAGGMDVGWAFDGEPVDLGLTEGEGD